MADEPQSAPAGEAEAPASFSLESAFKEAQQAVEPTVADAPKEEAPDSASDSTPSTDTEPAATPSGEEPKSNRQAGKEAYERGLREGEEKARQALEAERQRIQSEQSATSQRQQFEQLLTEANLPPDGSFETDQRRTAAQQKLGALYASNTVTRTAYERGQADYEKSFWNGFGDRLGQEIGLDDTGVKALMSEARSGIDFAKRLVDHGKTQEKAVWEPEIAKRDAKIEELQGKLASRTPSPEAGGGLRTNGTPSFDGSIKSAYELAKAQVAGAA
jgi:hypothetical protein